MPVPKFIGDSFLSDSPRRLTLERGFAFRRGETIAPFTITYETFGTLNADRSNAVLVCHALSANAHAAGKYTVDDEKPGWWDGLIGYGKGIDLDEHFVICVTFPGACFGTTSPSSINPLTEKPYGSAYPWVMIEDMVEAERLVLDHLGIGKLRSIAGGSLGGMQVLMWCALYPERVGSIISMAAAAAVPVEGVAWHIIGRKIIEGDSRFNNGDYYDDPEPLRGLQIARMVGHMTYLSLEALESKFGRRRRHGTRQFEIDSYLEYQGRKFSRTYDANSYIRIQAAMDDMDLDETYGGLEVAFARYQSPALLISFDTDWLFPPAEVAKVHAAMRNNGVTAKHLQLRSVAGHDTFLVDFRLITPPVREFLATLPQLVGGPS
ncbi:MAG: homoserine O-acetyltransferase MetX [Thermoanaerobaculia bacterium]